MAAWACAVASMTGTAPSRRSFFTGNTATGFSRLPSGDYQRQVRRWRNSGACGGGCLTERRGLGRQRTAAATKAGTSRLSAGVPSCGASRAPDVAGGVWPSAPMA